MVGAYSSTILVRNGKIIGGTIAIKSGNLKKDLLLNKFSFGTGSNMFFRREALKEIQGFDERFLRHQDIECMIRFLRKNTIVGINQILVVKCQDDRSNAPDIYKYENVKKLYIEAFKDDIEELTKKEQDEFYISNIQSLITIAIRGRKYNEMKKLKKQLRKYEEYNVMSKSNIINILKFINNYIPIEQVKEIIKRIKYGKKINKEEKELIKKILKDTNAGGKNDEC